MVELYPHQKEAVENLDNGKILWGGVGSGKSLTAVAYYMKKEAPRDVYVITTAKKRDALDWDSDFAKYGIGKTRDGTVGGMLTVDSWNNLQKYQDVKDAFFIFDEQRLVGSGAWTKAFIKIAKANRWILLSATPGDTWLDYIPVMVANGFYKNRTEFVREHVVYNTFTKFPKVDRYVNTGRLVKLRQQLLVEMPFKRHTERVIEHVDVQYDVELMGTAIKKRWNPFENRPMRDVAELFSVMRKICNSDPSRLDAIRTLLRKHEKLIVFYNFDYELEILRSLAWNPLAETISTPLSESISTVGEPSSSWEKPSFAVAEWNGHKHEAIPTTDRWVYLVQYVAGAEGWNCVETDAMAFYSLPFSYKNWHQAFGRIDRLNTPYARLFYYVLVAPSFIDQKIMENLLQKRDFNLGRYRHIGHIAG